MTYQVTVEPTGDVVEVEEGQTILDASLRQGVWLPFACGHGTCATCKCNLLEGDVDIGNASPFALMDMERDEGKILACCAIPESDLVIEADIDVDADFLGYPIEDFEATVVAFFIVGIGSFTYGFLEGVGFPALNTIWIMPLLIAVQGAAMFLVRGKYT